MGFCLSLSPSRWHYTCIDLQAIIANGFSPPDSYGYNGVHILDGFGFYADEDPESRGFYVDEFSFSHFARTLEIEVWDTRYCRTLMVNSLFVPNDFFSCRLIFLPHLLME